MQISLVPYIEGSYFIHKNSIDDVIHRNKLYFMQIWRKCFAKFDKNHINISSNELEQNKSQ